MHDPVLVGIAQPFGHLRADGDRLRHRQRAALADHRAQLDALDELHRHVGDVAGLADIVDGDDVGVVQAACGARLLVETGFVIADAGAFERHVDRLDGDGSLQHRVGRLVHDAHRAATELGLDDVAAELRRFH